MRIRTRSDWVTASEKETVVVRPESSSEIRNVSVTYGTEHQVMIDSPTPGFRRAQRNGVFCFTDAESAITSGIFRTLRNVDFTIKAKAADGTWYVTGGHQIIGASHYQPSQHSGGLSPLGGRLVNSTPSLKLATLTAFGQSDDGAAARDVCEKNVWAKAGSPDANVIVSLGEIDQLPKLFNRNSAILGQITKVIRTAPEKAVQFIWDLKVPQLVQLAKLSIKPQTRRALLAGLARTGPVAPLKGASLGLLRAIPALANSWLELRYGYLATCKDIESYLSVKKRRSLRRLVSSAPATPVTILNSTSTGIWSGGGPPTEATRVTRWTATVRRTWGSTHSAGLYVLTRPSAAVSNALGFPNLASAAWELSTLSFVVDWFIDIGKTIASLEGYLLTDWVGGWSTSIHDVQEVYNLRNELVPAPLPDRLVEGSMNEDYGIIQTTKYIIRKCIQPPSMFPSIKIKLNTKRMIDASALLAQQGGRLVSSLSGFKTR